MMPEPDNVVLVYLRRIDEKADRVIDDVRDIKFRVTNLDEGQAGIQRRLDRVECGWIASSGVSISSISHIEVMT
jgi:hypothetical protein